MALQEKGIPAGVVAHSKYLLESDVQLRHRGYWQTVDHPEMGQTHFTSPPYMLDGERVSLKRPPLFGEHTDAVLMQTLGYSAERVKSLRTEGVLE
jgi:benzylsuccinate CoA-transferase BbsF subunit